MRRKDAVILIAITGLFLLLFSNLSLAQETLTVTTYYPSPFGSYRELRWGNMPNTRGQLKADNGSSIELGGSGSPYIDFSNDMSSLDYDVRIQLTGNDTLSILGGYIDNICSRITYSGSSGNQECPANTYIAFGVPVNPGSSGAFLCCPD